jgi:Uma2 family endonuclease
VFEVRSPSDRWKDILAKVAEYLQAGVDTVCVVDPDSETIRIYLPDQPGTTLGINDTLALSDLLPDFSWPIKELFE